MRILVVGEHDGQLLRRASLSAIGFAQQLAAQTSGSFELLLLGNEIGQVAAEGARYAPVISATAPRLAHPLADRYAHVISKIVRSRKVDLITAASSTFSKDVLGRVGGLLGGAMASDVLGHEFVDCELYLRRPMFAGAVTATVVLTGEPKVLTVRASSYAAVLPRSEPSEVDEVTVDESALPEGTQFERVESKRSHRPDVTEARVVVSGGRAFKNSEDFERMVGRLADCFAGATGSSRALVDAGITPNELQVGQTGKIVAPEVYVALGISGAVQHLAGMKNSKTVIAVNSDADAPIFQFAHYGMVGDVYEIVPQLISKLKDV